MEQLSVGEDLFTTISVVGLIVLFSVMLVHSYHNYAERRNTYESLSTALDIAGQLKNDVLAKTGDFVTSGLISAAPPTGLENYFNLLRSQSIELCVEVRKLDGELLWSYGDESDSLTQYFSPPCSVSFPVAVNQSSSSRPLGELIVKIWRA
jgi:hypothetical protein